MSRWHYIGMDAHCSTCELDTVDRWGNHMNRQRVPTRIPSLVEAIEQTPRPRSLAFEEGTLADWLYRNLKRHVDDIIVADPRRNALIAKESDKDDSIDAGKLADLLRGGYLKPVHHPESCERAVFRHHVGLYYEQVRHRVREANRIMGHLRQWGIFVRESQFSDDILTRLPAQATLRKDFGALFAGYDFAVELQEGAKRELRRLARKEPQIRRWEKVPGIGWIRAATLFCYLDTPWRFKSKGALCKYMGIGLERRHSGTGRMRVRVCWQANMRLKAAIIGAAQRVMRMPETPFAQQYERWLHGGCPPCVARRNVARSLAAVMWGMWKNGNEYSAELVGRSAGEVSH